MSDQAPAPARFRFRPRLRAFPWLLVAAAVWLVVAAFLYDLRGSNLRLAIGSAAAGVLLALAYWFSPAWRLVVEVDDAGLVVRRGDSVRVRIAWNEVVMLRHSPRWKTAFVDAGAADRRLVVPGPDTPAPYRIERREALWALLVEHVPAERRQETDRPTAEGSG